MRIKKGTPILLTDGDWSDYQIRAKLEAAVSFDTDDAVDRYLEEFPEQKRVHNSDFDKFILWLQENNYVIESKTIVEWFVGSYRTFDKIDIDA